jgi:hypothetical protein
MIKHMRKVKVAERLSLDVRAFGTFRFIQLFQMLKSHQHKHVHTYVEALKTESKTGERECY